jgi:hypothetical protein
VLKAVSVVSAVPPVDVVNQEDADPEVGVLAKLATVVLLHKVYMLSLIFLAVTANLLKLSQVVMVSEA